MRTLVLSLALTIAGLSPVHAASFRRTLTIGNAVGGAESSFGASMSGTGTGGLLVGAPVDSAGSAQLFDALSGALVLTIPGPPLSFGFGSSVGAVGADLLVGDPTFLVGDPSVGGAFVGAVHRYDATSGALEHTFLSPAPADGAGFGRRISLDGTGLLVGEAGVVHLFDVTSTALLGSIAAPPGSTSTFGSALLLRDGLAIVGDPDANRVFVFDAGSGALLHTIENPVSGEAASFGFSLAQGLFDDLLVGAPGAEGSIGRAYCLDLPAGRVKVTYRNPAPSPGDAFGYAVGTYGDAVLVGAIGDDLMEEGVRDGAVHVFDRGIGALLVGILGRDGWDFMDAFGAAIESVGDQVFVSAPDEDINTVTGFRLDCGGVPCRTVNTRLAHARVRLGAGNVRVRSALKLTPSEFDELAASGGSLCVLGPPNLVHCAPFACSGDDRVLSCPVTSHNSTGLVTVSRRGRSAGKLLATITDIAGAPTTTGPVAVRLNVGPGAGDATRGAGLRKCRGTPTDLLCR